MNNPESCLEDMWIEHREYLRRILAAWTRNLDLADDLLQETYLRANAGLKNYRGEGERAWLSAIARNVFLGHVRRKYYTLEIPSEIGTDGWTDSDLQPGSEGHIDQLSIREAVTNLSPAMRTALIMRHYGGFTYEEIAARLSCPQGTAQRRVWDALHKLRTTLGVESGGQTSCEKLKGTLLLDYVYGTIQKDLAVKIDTHLKECDSCRREAALLRGTARILDTAEPEMKSVYVYELDNKGGYTAYETYRSGELDIDDDGSLLLRNCYVDEVMMVVVNGKELPFEKTPIEGTSTEILKVRPAKPLKRGDPVQVFVIYHSGDGVVRNAASFARYFNPDNYDKSKEIQMRDPLIQELSDKLGGYDETFKILLRSMGGRERVLKPLPENAFRHVVSSWMPHDSLGVVVMAVNLADDLKVLDAYPPPNEVRDHGRTTLLWRKVIAPTEPLTVVLDYQAQ